MDCSQFQLCTSARVYGMIILALDVKVMHVCVPMYDDAFCSQALFRHRRSLTTEIHHNVMIPTCFGLLYYGEDTRFSRALFVIILL